MRKMFLLLAPFLFAALSFRTPNLFTISGKITNENGQSLSAVSITYKPGNNSVMSNPDGTYSISVPEKTGSLVFSMVGYESKKVKIGGNGR